MDPLSTTAAGIAVARGGWSFLGFLRDCVGAADIISATYDHTAARTAGDEIEVSRHPTDHELMWVYEVKPIEGYTFVPLAVQPDAVIQSEQASGDVVRTPRLFRWLAPPRPGTLYTTDKPLANLAVDFIIIGYRPEALRQYLAGD